MKIKILAGDINHIQLWPMLKVKNKLSDLGITFVESNPDMILYHTYKAPELIQKRAFTSTIPVMILERIASARILSTRVINQDNIVGVLKSTSYRDLNLNNSNFNIEQIEYPEKEFKNNYHSKLIYEAMNIPSIYSCPPKSIDPKYFNKVELWYNFACYQMMEPYINNSNSLNSNRSLDIGFIGTTTYGEHSLPITKHRRCCIEVLKSLKNCQTEVIDHRISEKSKYMNNIINSLIGISPWGLGEKCYRDFEVIFGGGILVKPDTSFVTDWTDTYSLQNNYYVPCKIDFSDLQQIVDTIKTDSFHYIELQRQSRQNLIQRCWNNEIIATHISNVFKHCAERIK